MEQQRDRAKPVVLDGSWTAWVVSIVPWGGRFGWQDSGGGHRQCIEREFHERFYAHVAAIN